MRSPIKLSEAQYDRLVDHQALVCMRCGAIGPSTQQCDDGSEHELITIVDAEASGVVDVDFQDEH
ncbi:MAG TPA: hypothetical protein VFD92_24315 [Candidatus Binatia bacterium]|nr:hypothetical protein [Candidatus Binatia bacterium]